MKRNVPNIGRRIEAADLSMRGLLLYLVVPMFAGTALIYWAYRLHLQRLIRYGNGGFIDFLNIAGGGICLICGFGLVTTLLAKLARRLFRCGQNTTDVIALSTGPAFVLTLYMILLSSIGDRYRTDNEAALDAGGIARSFPVMSRTYRRTKHPHFELDIRVPDKTGRLHQLRVDYPNHPSVDDIDSVAIRYLPGNPEIFRSLESWY